MSLAELVITSVEIERRSRSELARDYNISRTSAGAPRHVVALELSGHRLVDSCHQPSGTRVWHSTAPVPLLRSGATRRSC